MTHPSKTIIRKEAAPGGGELRQRAEKRLRQQRTKTDSVRTEPDTQRLVHELQVHQIELEMQNEELQQARSELEAGLEKYRDLYDFAPVGYLTLDCEGTIRKANLAAASLLEIPRSRLLEQRFGHYVVASDRHLLSDFLTRVYLNRNRECCELHLLKDGHSGIEVRMEAGPTTGEECRVVLENITDLKRAEADRLVLNKLESTGILAGGIAHDFNNLLTVILLDLELALEFTAPGAGLTELLEEAKKAGWTARSLTQQLIIFANGGAPIRKPVHLAGVIQESSRAAAGGSRMRCEFSLADNLWPVAADAGQIGQVIHNLVQNAREAIHGEGVVSVRAENVVLQAGANPSLPPGDYVQVSIADQGAGIAKEVLPKIFDPYFSTKEKGNQKGMGLGLTICHSIIQKHGGTITVKSEAGAGATFQILLPASRNLPAPPEKTTSGPAPQPLPRKILVMDDEETVRNLIGTIFRQMGHAVELVADGEHAIQAYQNATRQGNPFDAVVLDLTVHAGLGGRETLETLLQFDPDVQAVVMSGYSNDPVLLEPERHGFKEGLAKPFNRDQLQNMISRILDHLDHRPAP
jgi:signal transduction histidine kinase/ActR/RegA family two-component response regulator